MLAPDPISTSLMSLREVEIEEAGRIKGQHAILLSTLLEDRAWNKLCWQSIEIGPNTELTKTIV